MSTWVLLRGLTREAGHWGDFIGQLAAGLPDARILTLDLPGNGIRHGETSPTRVEDMVEACRAELATRRLVAPVHLLAMSLGAMVAVAWAAARPQELAACVLINTSLRPFSPFHHRLRPSSYPAQLGVLAGSGPRRKEAAILRLTSHIADPVVLDDWVRLRRAHPVSPANALRQLLAAARFRSPPHAPAVPMLVLSGAADALVDPRCSATLAARWGLALARHPSAGHDLPLDDGAWVVKRIQAWLAADGALRPGP